MFGEGKMFWNGGPYPLVDLDRGSKSTVTPVPASHKEIDVYMTLH